jgi:hypothetical protein
MIDINEQIEAKILDMLQSNVVIYIGDKKYRTGKLQNFKVMDLYVQISLIVSHVERKFEFPTPFKVIKTKDELAFSYEVSELGDFGNKLDEKVKKTFGIPKSKLYNQRLRIKRS